LKLVTKLGPLLRTQERLDSDRSPDRERQALDLCPGESRGQGAENQTGATVILGPPPFAKP
jgi:hypothetical protein